MLNYYTCSFCLNQKIKPNRQPGVFPFLAHALTRTRKNSWFTPIGSSPVLGDPNAYIAQPLREMEGYNYK
jgi:hypothetical protein